MGQTQSPRDARILAELQEAVLRMHVLAGKPRVLLINGTRAEGPRPLAWQVLFERSLGPDAPRLRYRGTGATSLPHILSTGFDSEPTLGDGWSHDRLGQAMEQGPVIQAFRADRLPDDVANALVGVLVFVEDGLALAGVRAVVKELGLR